MYHVRRLSYAGRVASRAPLPDAALVPLSKYRYIVVEGPIGVGKTSLAKRLSERLGTGALLE